MFQNLLRFFPPVGHAARTPLFRAALFAGCLILLWGALQFISSGKQGRARVYSDGSGTVAARTQPAAPSRREPGTFGFGSFVALSILAGGGAYAVYLRRKAPNGPQAAQAIEVLGQLQIAPNQALKLVGCGGDVLLLGITSGQISLLKSYPRSTFEPSRTRPAYEPDRRSTLSLSEPFADFLRQYAARAATSSRVN